MLPALELSPRAIIAPSLVVTSSMLGCNLTELSQRLLIEAADNPALQLLAVRNCPRCGFPLSEDNKCLFCARQSYPPISTPDTPSDWEERLVAPDGFRDELLSQARLALDPADHTLAEFIVAALDEHGVLSGNVLRTATLPQRAERVLRVIQSLDPPGIAARDTPECFRLQLERLDIPIPPLVYRLIERWGNLPENPNTLARTLGVSLDELNQTFEFMRKYLNPYPIVAAPDVLPYRHVDVAIIHTPDAEAQFEIIIAPGPRVRASDNPAVLGEADFSPGDWRALAQHAQLVNRALHNREQIMEQIFILLAHKQTAYLLNGPRHHNPVTRAEIAHTLSVHASTVGRAVTGKSVLVPSGQIVPADIFFDRGLAIKHAIKEIVDQEATPLTDELLRQRLAVQGIVIARRTVAKYRAAAGVLPIHLRWHKS